MTSIFSFIVAIESPTNPSFPPAADRLYGRTVDPGFPPGFLYELRKVTKPAQGNTAEETQTLQSGNVSMTDAQWDAWTNQPAEEYVPPCIAENLGLVIVDMPAPKSGTATKSRRR